MPENQVLTFDLGSNSIGNVIRNTTEENQFKKAVVITFDTGVGKDKENKYTISLAANRTSKRSIRRLYQSRKYKLWALLEVFIKNPNKLYCPIREESLKRWKYYNKEEAQKGNGGRKYPVNDTPFANWIKLDFNNDGVPDYISPFQLRNELVSEKLDFNDEINRFKLGRALYHIAQHRGFKSSKIVNNKDDENKEQPVNTEDGNIGAEKRKQENFIKELEKIGFIYDPNRETVGTLFSRVEIEGIHHPDRKIEGIRIRKNLHQYVTRKMLIKEVKKIFDFQQLDFSEIFSKEGEKISIPHSTIFWQRPLRSQKGLVGYCTLENRKIFDENKEREVIGGKKRCPVSRPEFEEFRALSFINNIAYREKGNKDSEWKFLPPEMRHELYLEKFFVQKDFDFIIIAKWIKQKNKHDNWEFNYNYKTNVSACIISARLKKILGEDWNKTVTHTSRDRKTYTTAYYEDLWHVLFESDDQDFVEEYGKTKLKLDDEKVQQLRSLWFAMPVGYAQLSLKAINNILSFLREGFIYTDAVLLGKVPEILGGEIWESKKEFITESLKSSVIETNREEKRILNIVNNLISQYKARPKGNGRFADHDTSYIVGSRDSQLPVGSIERDDVQIANAIEEGFGKKTWEKLSPESKQNAFQKIREGYQQFFQSSQRDFFKLPRLGDVMKKFLADNFPDLLYCPKTFKKQENGEEKCNCEKCKRLNKLYHPSMIAIYPQARDEYYKYDGKEIKKVMLGSPKTGSFRNPMAMRTLHELKKLVNYYIATGQVDEETRVVVEVGRELNDTNKRWAIEKYQEIRRKENEEFADAIFELLKDPDAKGSLADADSDSDIDKFRLWYEMIDSPEGFEKSGKFTVVQDDRISKEKKGKRKKKMITEDGDSDEEDFYEFSENHFESIKNEVWIKLKKAKDNIVEKYRLWKEQQCFCIYTGNPIRITDLFKETVIDIEHTIPRSVSFDNSLANKTVCFADYNRNSKKNQIPADLPNYDDITTRIEAWKQKVKDLEVRVEFWKGKSKRASTPEYKNKAIREKHLWQFELDYWRNKVDRFTMKEVKPGFKNSQLKDTQIISKYALHYLKSYFNHVEVQKGEVTAQFRKIFEIQETGTKKDRSKHSHHAKDAMVLSVIPVAAIRDRMLELWYKIKEDELLLKSDTEKNKTVIQEKIRQMEEELNDYKVRLKPKGFNNAIRQLDETILINNIARNRSVIPASKKVRIKGKDFVAQGDAIRGELHLATMYGKLQMVERDENDKPLRDENGKWKFLEGDNAFKFGLRKEVDKNLDIDKIVDPTLKKIIRDQIGNRSLAATLSEDGGLYMLNKAAERVHKIRHVRCFEPSVTNPVHVRKQDIVSNKEHKKYYWAKNGENILCVLYQKSIKDKKGNEKINRELDIITLMDVAKLVQKGVIKGIDELEIYRTDKKNGESIIDENGNKEKPYAFLKPGMKVIFYDNNIFELKIITGENEQNYKSRISYRTYVLVKFSGGQITFKHHLEGRSDDELKKAYPKNEYGVGGTSGFTKKVSDALTKNKMNYYEPWPKLLYTMNWLNMAIEDTHFEIMSDGEIKWLF